MRAFRHDGVRRWRDTGWTCCDPKEGMKYGDDWTRDGQPDED
jgi:hypothetical protein